MKEACELGEIFKTGTGQNIALVIQQTNIPDWTQLHSCQINSELHLKILFNIQFELQPRLFPYYSPGSYI